jgi:DNA-directed RNA polymerase subunit K/omega
MGSSRREGSTLPTDRPPDLSGALSGFHLTTVVFQRAKQLKAGARPRVEARDHKPTRVALLEVLAETVSWEVGADPKRPFA